jgi:hypothetical protein
MGRRIVFVVFSFFVLLGGVVFLYHDGISGAVDRFSLYVQYREGARFYRDSDEKAFRTDERWFSSLLFEYREAVLRGDAEPVYRDPFLRVLGEGKRVFSIFESFDPAGSGGEYRYRIKKEYRHFLVNPWDDVLLRILYCGTYGYSDRDFAALASIPLDGAYADTNKLFGLILLREQGCYDREKLDRIIRQGAEHLSRSAENDREWSDLFSERVVFLYWAGEGSLVKREWIDLIADAQQQDGGWADPALSDDSNAHSTGLSMLAIRYFLEGNDEVRFFAPLDPEDR